MNIIPTFFPVCRYIDVANNERIASKSAKLLSCIFTQYAHVKIEMNFYSVNIFNFNHRMPDRQTILKVFNGIPVTTFANTCSAYAWFNHHK